MHVLRAEQGRVLPTPEEPEPPSASAEGLGDFDDGGEFIQFVDDHAGSGDETSGSDAVDSDEDQEDGEESDADTDEDEDEDEMDVHG